MGARARVLCGMLLAVGLSMGCGYRFTAGGAPLPQGIHHVFAPVFGNRTSEPTLEVAFTQALREQLGRAGVEGGTESEARIEGELIDLQSVAGFQELTRTAANGAPNATGLSQVPVYRVLVRAHLKLKKAGTVLAETDVFGSEDYLSAQGDILGTEANREAALRRLAQSMMQDGYGRFTSGF